MAHPSCARVGHPDLSGSTKKLFGGGFGDFLEGVEGVFEVGAGVSGGDAEAQSGDALGDGGGT